jgi:uncharacterized protein
MSYLPSSLCQTSFPVEEAAFWEHCNNRRLTFQACAKCGKVVHPPVQVCSACQSFQHVWIDAPNEARVFSYTWVYAAADQSVVSCIPYNISLVEFPMLPGIRLVTNVVDVKPGELAIGDPLTVHWDRVADGRYIPRFQKIQQGGL